MPPGGVGCTGAVDAEGVGDLVNVDGEGHDERGHAQKPPREVSITLRCLVVAGMKVRV